MHGTAVPNQFPLLVLATFKILLSLSKILLSLLSYLAHLLSLPLNLPLPLLGLLITTDVVLPKIELISRCCQRLVESASQQPSLLDLDAGKIPQLFSSFLYPVL